jgi:hypothetical protein
MSSSRDRDRGIGGVWRRTAREHRRALRIAAGIAVGAVAVAVVGVLVLHPGGEDDLRAMPELYLAYPGSVVLRDAEIVNPGIGPYADRLYGSNASIEEVEDWYRRELTSRGWLPGAGSSAATSTDELAVCAWHTAQYRFRLGFWRRDIAPELDPHAADYASIYEVAIIPEASPVSLRECTSSPLRLVSPSPSP